MALSDILNRIESDAAHEARAVIEAAEAEAESIVAAAAGHASEWASRFERASARTAQQDAETIMAGARLAARDAEVRARGELVDRALSELGERIVALPDAGYTAFIARAVVGAAIGGETVKIAEADRVRLGGLEAAVAGLAREAGRELRLVFSAEPADVAHGVVLVGDRSRSDLSVAGLIDAQRESLVMRLASALFSEGNDDA